jgi:hypothetical protein
MVAFEDAEFQFAFERALGASYRQAADVGEVLATGSVRSRTSGARPPTTPRRST